MTSYNNDFPFLRILTCLEPKHIRNRRKNNHNVDKIRNTKSQGVIINRHARCQKKNIDMFIRIVHHPINKDNIIISQRDD